MNPAAPTIELRAATRDDLPLLVDLVGELAEYESRRHEVLLDAADLGRGPVWPAAAVRGFGGPSGERAGGIRDLVLFVFHVSGASESVYRGSCSCGRRFAAWGWAGRSCGDWRRLAAAPAVGGWSGACSTWNEPAIAFYHSLGAQLVADWQVYQLSGGGLGAAGRRAGDGVNRSAGAAGTHCDRRAGRGGGRLRLAFRSGCFILGGRHRRHLAVDCGGRLAKRPLVLRWIRPWHAARRPRARCRSRGMVARGAKVIRGQLVAVQHEIVALGDGGDHAGGVGLGDWLAVGAVATTAILGGASWCWRRWRFFWGAGCCCWPSGTARSGLRSVAERAQGWSGRAIGLARWSRGRGVWRAARLGHG